MVGRSKASRARRLWPSWLVVLTMLAGMAASTSVIAYDDPEPSTPIDFVRKNKIFLSPGGEPLTSIALGPDGRLYVSTLYGTIFGMTLDAAYNVIDIEQFDTIHDTPNFNEDGTPAPGIVGRLVLGITFDPQSSPSQPVMYVSHSDPGISPDDPINTVSGAVTRLTGPNFDSPANRLDVITGLPRSGKNHATNSVTFGPDGWLYIAQGGNTDLGTAHVTWGNIPEFYLSAAILRADVRTMQSTLDVRDVTTAADMVPHQGTFELFATGFRNAYDLVWHSSGDLYVNENGANVFQGTTPGPAHGCPDGEAILVPDQNDAIFVTTQGMYAGHPNPARGECIFKDGSLYSPPKTPEPNYQPPLREYAYNLGEVSMDGIAEYPVGAMAGNLISATFSGTELLLRVILNPDGSATIARIHEYGAFDNPLDLVIDDAGTIYVAEFGLDGNAGVSLLIPEAIATPELSLTGVSPNTGPVEGGTSVTLSGTLFASGATVTFGGVAATNVTVVNETTITATTPAHAAGSVSVTVTNPGGESDTLAGAFTYTSGGGGASLVRINAGGGGYTDGSGAFWSGDNGASGGSTYATGSAIANTTDDPLYQSERYGNFSYTSALENGDYLVTLKFAEIYWNTPGQRVFDIAINGQLVLDNFDILSETAPLTALDKSFPVSVTNGSLTITFTTVTDNAKVAAIEIVSSGDDTTPPAVTSVDPPDGATEVALDSSISVTFSEPMNEASVEAAFQLSPAHTGTFSWNPSSTSMTFTPLEAISELRPETLYTATIGAAATDLAGNPLGSATVWTFTTTDDEDTTPPIVTSTNPVDGATNVAPTSVLSVTFSEPMDQAVTQAAFDTTPSLSGTFSWNPAGTTMTFTPASSLAEGQTYTASVAASASDQNGNTLGTQYDWNFTTSSGGGAPPPTLNGVNPTSGPTTGGTNVTLSGSDFASGATVTFGGVAATNVAVVNSTTITATTPAHAAGSVNVTVTNPDGQSDTLTSAFTYTSGGGGTSLVRINAGGGGYTDGSGAFWSGDTGANGGSTYSTGSAIANTTDDLLYQSERYGNFSYTVSLANGDYLINLKFAEIYWTTPGQRVFDVAINGQLVLDNFDILSETAPLTALDKSFAVSVTNGSLTITFTTVANNAKVAAIEITGDDGGGGDTTPPSVTSTNPANGSTDIAVNSTISVTFSEAMNQSSAQGAFSINPVTNGSFSWNGAGTVMTFMPSTELLAEQVYSIAVNTGATDLAGNALSNAANWSFTTESNVDVTPPSVTGTSPVNGAVDVPLAASVSVTFSEAMNQASAQAAFSITPNTAGTFSWNGAGTTMTFSPNAALSEDTLYTASVGTGATDLAGNSLDSAANWSFTTAAGADTTPPSVNGTNPANGAVDVVVDTTVSVTFSEAMNQFSAEAAFSITPSTTGSFSWNGAGTVLTFTPSSDLLHDQLYAVEVDTGATDLAGNNLNAAVNWSFTTVAPPPDPAPDLTGLNPTSGSISGGTSVTLTGANFVAGATVMFGGISATNVGVVNSTTITATTPAHAAGSVNVTVTNSDGQSDTLANAFTYTSGGGGTSLVRLNAGGGGYTDGSGAFWSGDTGASGGGSYSTGSAIANTTDDPLYQSERYGNFSYTFDLDNGDYLVNLKFAEIYWTTTGQRVFDVSINGQLVLDNFDILSEVPRLVALDKSFAVSVTNGSLTITFTTVADNAKVAAIEITGDDGGGGDTTPPTVTSTSPLDGATSVSVGATISATFSEEMDQASVEAAFSVSPTPGGSFSWNAAGTTVTFTPADDLLESQSYTVSVGTGAMDLAGNPLANAYNWDFTTAGGGGGDTTPPIVSANPQGGTYQTAQSVTLSANEPATIYYTTDGSVPDESSAEYTAPIAINATTTLRFFGVDAAGNASVPVTENYVIDAGDPPPNLLTITPTSGPTAGGTSVTLSGSDFASGATVTIGGSPATNVVVVNSTTITASTPAHAAGSVNVTVTNPDGQSDTLTSAFTYTSDSGDTGQWVQMPPLPEAVAEVGVVQSGGKIYLLGGGGSAEESNPVFVFDPVQETWSQVAPYPGPARDHAGAASVNGIVYMIGGLTAWPNEAVGDVYAYDPGTDTWTQKASLPRDRGAMGVAVLNGKIYAMGGLVDGGTAVTDLTVYDPQTDSWTELEPMPTPRDHLVAAAVNGLIFAIGGRPVDINSPLAVNEAYDPGTDIWETRAPMPTARAGHGTGVLDGKIVVFGGEGNLGSPTGTFSETEEYDPVTDTWRSLAPMITARHGTNGAVFDNTIYVPGGGPSQGGSSSTVHEAFRLVSDGGPLSQSAGAVMGFLSGWFVCAWIWRSRRALMRRKN